MKRKAEEDSEKQVREKPKDNRKTEVSKNKTNLITNNNSDESPSIPVEFKHSDSETVSTKRHKTKDESEGQKIKSDSETVSSKRHKTKDENEGQKIKKIKLSRNTKLLNGEINLTASYHSEERSSVPVGFRHSKSETRPRKLLKKKPSVKTFLARKKKFVSFKKKGKLEKPDWSQLKAHKKERKLKRKVEKTGHEHYELTVKCKQLWEKVRRNDCPKQEQSKLLEELFLLVKGQVHMVIHNHDMARVAQWLLKLGCEDIRMRLCEELCAHLVSLLQSKYASFCVKRAFKYVSAESRRHIIECVKGYVVKLLSHSIAGPVIESMYSTWATAVERSWMRLELYGDLCSKYIQPECNAHSILESVSNDLRPAVLAATKTNLEKLVDKKHTMTSTLLHIVVLDFLQHCNENDKKEMLENLNPYLFELQKSKHGVSIATLIVQTGTNKLKKNAVKSVKGHLKEIATSEHGHLFLMTIFDHVDDTVLIKKALFPELLENVVDIARNEHGRKVLLYIVAHKDTLFFHPMYIKSVQESVASGTCKKDAAVREKELLDGVSEPLLEKIANDPATWIGDPNLSMFSFAVLKSGSGNKLTQALNSVAKYASDKESKVNYNNRMYHAVEHSIIHMVFKKLIQHDKNNLEKGLSTFSQAFVSKLKTSRLRNLLELNRGCFLLIGVLEGDDKEAVKLLKSKFTEEIKTMLESQETTGARILIKKLNSE